MDTDENEDYPFSNPLGPAAQHLLNHPIPSINTQFHVQSFFVRVVLCWIQIRIGFGGSCLIFTMLIIHNYG